MEEKNLEKALEIFGELIIGEEISRNTNLDLYEDYLNIAQVYDILTALLKKTNLKLYEYNETLYVTAGEKNRIFGFSNDELKKEIGLRLNKELFLAYFVIYQVVTLFYKDSRSFSYMEYVQCETVVEQVSISLKQLMPKLEVVVKNDNEGHSFKTIALLWEDLPMITANEDLSSLKAARGTKVGFVKLVFNFLVSQELFHENGGRYYARDRFKALVENYYEDAKGRLYEILSEGEEEVNATY